MCRNSPKFYNSWKACNVVCEIYSYVHPPAYRTRNAVKFEPVPVQSGLYDRNGFDQANVGPTQVTKGQRLSTDLPILTDF